MSSPLLLLLILLSCLSLHVFDARHLRLTKKENAKVQVYHFTKVWSFNINAIQILSHEFYSLYYYYYLVHLAKQNYTYYYGLII
jgi:hypothetical protein